MGSRAGNKHSRSFHCRDCEHFAKVLPASPHPCCCCRKLSCPSSRSWAGRPTSGKSNSPPALIRWQGAVMIASDLFTSLKKVVNPHMLIIAYYLHPYCLLSRYYPLLPITCHIIYWVLLEHAHANQLDDPSKGKPVMLCWICRYLRLSPLIISILQLDQTNLENKLRHQVLN